MSYSQSFFGKDLKSILYRDVVSFFSVEQSESDKIEYKAYAFEQSNMGAKQPHKEKLNDVIKTICGMLNSVGGLIIWGAPIGRNVKGKKEKIFQGDLSPVTEYIENDSFISTVSQRITPIPSQIRFHRIESESKGEFVYIIEVDQSPYAPHQFQHKYFMRLDGQTQAAPHQYVEALFRKITYPNLEGYLEVTEIRKNPHGHTYIIDEIDLNVFIFNLSELQNEHDLYFHLEASIGSFGSSIDDIADNIDNTLIQFNAQPTLFFKAPFRTVVTLSVWENWLIRNGFRLEVTLYFGGKKSPLKVSRYVYDLNPDARFMNLDIVIEKSENRLVSTLDRVHVASPKDQIASILRNSYGSDFNR